MKNPVSRSVPISLKRVICLFLFFLVIPYSISPLVQDKEQGKGEIKYSVEEAFKVLKLIEKIEVEQMERGRPALSNTRKVEVTESEFNSYIAYRIDIEEEEIMRGLQFKFFEENKVEGRIFIDLRGQNLPAILKPEMNIFFSAEIETNNGAVRMNVKDLFVENRKVMPAVLDLIIAISAKLTGEEATSINDWYALPYGIGEIVIQPGKATFFF